MAKQGTWVKFRKPIGKYPMTPQQMKVKVGGEMIKEVCTGKKGEDFAKCRREVLRCAFHDEECEGDLAEVKKDLLEA